jgi:hypothetical protein
MTLKQSVNIIEPKGINKELELCFNNMYRPNLIPEEHNIFEHIALLLIKHIKADYVFIGLVNKDENILESLAFCNRKEILPPFTTSYNGSIWHKILISKTATFQENTQLQFTQNKKLPITQFKSCIGVPIYLDGNKPVGILATLYTDRLYSILNTESFLYMCSLRISAEIQRQKHEQILKQSNLAQKILRKEIIKKENKEEQLNMQFEIMKSKIKELSKLKSYFLANLSHEIRTPMNAIIGFTELLKSNNFSPKEKEEYLEIVHQNGNQLMNVIDALIDISKLQAQTYSEKVERISVNNLFSKLHTRFSTK